ncbi:MAG: phosphoribosylanthranilate isomerase [Alphaproteobacteria bacterium]|nr:phosphoribosylanthranilate isomerase [Alphaproteobacteria bacterium]
MTITVKICGLTSADLALAAWRNGAAYAGLVFHPASPRNLSLEQGRAIADAIGWRLKRVALVADAEDAQLAAIKAAVQPDFLQLHGHESVARTAEIRGRFALPVIKALSVAEAGDLQAAGDYAAVADMLLFDAKPPKGAERGGGHGTAFDWRLMKGRRFGKPWFLAGGLTPENVERAVELSGAEMVDVSSGVESAPGVKSTDRISQFFSALRRPVQA